MDEDERTPLLFGRRVERSWPAFGAELPILIACFIISLSFSVTQVPILYAFHLMECEIFYQDHPPYKGVGDRCSLNEVEAGTATQFSILGMTTTVCGTLNLFVAGWAAKRFGPRLSLLIQTLVPAIRAGVQTLGVTAGGRTGITIFQCTQLIAIAGGPAGYILVVNIMASEMVEPHQRTSTFGKLQGSVMLGQGVGYLVGGLIGDSFGIRRPFEVSLVLFVFATVYVKLALPDLAPEPTIHSRNTFREGVTNFFSPLRVLAPHKVRLVSGQLVNHYGVVFLCCGVFIGVLATDYAPFMIQMYATAEFDFSQAENGWLISGWAVMRSAFLLLLFPCIITNGRKRSSGADLNVVVPVGEDIPEVSDVTDDREDLTTGAQAQNELNSTEATHRYTDHLEFDLMFLRWSLVIDGILTTGAAFASQRWHIYLAVFLLPLGSGSAPAAKGVITNMCSASKVADALNAITLIENIARLATQGLFGLIFAILANAGRAYLTFLCNAAIALLGMGVLLLSHFPPRNSKLVGD